MATVESLNSLLNEVTALLDRAAHEIRDVPLQPTGHNIRCIARALTEVFEIQYQICALQPELTPVHLQEASERPQQMLEDIFKRAQFFEDEGVPMTALAFLEFFVRYQKSEPELQKARDEIVRLKGKYGI